MEIITDDIKHYDQNWWDNFYSKHTHQMSGSDQLHFETIGKIVGDKSLIDIGCGEGHLSKFVKNYVGVDWSEKAVEKAIKKYGNKFLVWNFDKEFRPKIDYAAMCEVFEHVENPKEFINKVKQVADKVIVALPNGDFGRITVENDTDLMKTISEHTKYHYATYTKEDILKMFPEVEFLEADEFHLMFII